MELYILDVEGHEEKVLKGGIKSILKYKPYLTLEDHSHNNNTFIRVLKDNYTFIEFIHSNAIYIPNK